MWVKLKDWVQSKTIIKTIQNGYLVLGVIVIVVVGIVMYRGNSKKK